MRKSDFETMTLLKAFTYVDPDRGCVVRQEVRRDPFTGVTLTCKVPMTIDTPNTSKGEYAYG